MCFETQEEEQVGSSGYKWTLVFLGRPYGSQMSKDCGSSGGYADQETSLERTMKYIRPWPGGTFAKDRKDDVTEPKRK